MELKPYQAGTLAILRRFLERARLAGPAAAYDEITAEPEVAARLGRWRGAYRALDGLPATPYVCLRLPTGGGKTILAAHTVAIAKDAWIERDYPFVLWLVPSNTIRTQTVDALRNPRHAYRRALDDAFGGRVRVFDIADFAQITPQDVREQVSVVVGTIQTLRVGNTEGRRVYAHNENMEPHFTAVAPSTPGLERIEEGPGKGGIKFSFANLMHRLRPLMIVDEAHGAVTGLTREMQARVNPAAVVEFTATPRPDSNILHSVSARELKQAEMVKLPIILAERDSWQGAVNGAVERRAALAQAAEADPGRIRPIVLFQAQQKNREVTADLLRRHLIEAEGVPEYRIAVVTAGQRELDGIDLFDPACPIEHIITVEALKEGWDCSFAYVFCSVSRIHDATDVEQLLGRVLRMPFAQKRPVAALNKAYAYVSEPSFAAAAAALVDSLVKMGFDRDEAEEQIEPEQLPLDGGLFAPAPAAGPVFSHVVEPTPELHALLDGPAGERLSAVPRPDGTIELRIAGPVSAALEAAIAYALPQSGRPGMAEAVRAYRLRSQHLLSPAERGEMLVVPRLVAEVQGTLELADTDLFMEFHDWTLADHPVEMTADEFGVREGERSFEIDLDGDRIGYQFTSASEQLALDVDVEGWTPENLTIWLERQVRCPDLHPSDLLRWLRLAIRHLLSPRGLKIAALMRAKFILARKLRERIDAARVMERRNAYQRHLFAPEARVELAFDEGFTFRDGMYAEVPRAPSGRFRFIKHFLGADAVPAFDGPEGGEEFRCAQAVEARPEVEFWVRNVARHPASFWLPTASGKFYPDFVARLIDGRLLVVEYKGAHLADGADTDEKRTIGRLWEASSRGKGLFIVVERTIDGRDMHDQLRAKLAMR